MPLPTTTEQHHREGSRCRRGDGQDAPQRRKDLCAAQAAQEIPLTTVRPRTVVHEAPVFGGTTEIMKEIIGLGLGL